ncbi:hypothetical protein M0812_24938 [Anaeramoeba flamelloides]|uniref:non-specific serine/threonine protein kinase n=1 Tax=Anaeramoeba flamelloides TaxID=1746091 RepID=A0AAV7YIC7_9EUKA|nr:hypothetical protein M0812_24938 [Anaeramoeba flamelloides]
MSTKSNSSFKEKRKRNQEGDVKQKKRISKGKGKEGRSLNGRVVRRGKTLKKKKKIVSNKSKSKVNEKKIKRNSKVGKRESTNGKIEDQDWVELGKTTPKKTIKTAKTKTKRATATKTKAKEKTPTKAKTTQFKKKKLHSRTISKTTRPKKRKNKKLISINKTKSQPNSPIVKRNEKLKKVTKLYSDKKSKKQTQMDLSKYFQKRTTKTTKSKSKTTKSKSKSKSKAKTKTTKTITKTKKPMQTKPKIVKKRTIIKKINLKKKFLNPKKNKTKTKTETETETEKNKIEHKSSQKQTFVEPQLNKEKDKDKDKYKYKEEEENVELGLLTSSESDEENPDDYRKGGYHPTKVGEIFKKRYKALFKIGWGYFSTVWLIEDIKYGGKLVRTKTGKIIKKEKCLALKIVKSSKVFAQVAIDEIKILMKSSSNNTNQASPVVRLHDHFLHQGPNGKHICMAFEFLDQKNLLSLIRQYGVNGLPIPIVKEITRQALKGLDHLHSKCKIIHTDIKPENIMLYSKIGNIPTRLKEKMEHAQKRTELKKQLNLQGKKINQNQNTNKKQRGKSNNNDPKQNSEEHSESDSNSDDFMNITKTGGEMTQQFIHRQSKTRLIKTLNKEGNNYLLKKKNKKFEKSGSGLSLTKKEQDLLLNGLNNNNEDEHEHEKEKRKKREQFLKKVTPDRIKCKIVDLGNACWYDKHFSSEIQTREYRSPEVILGHDYDWTADIWSMGCMIFELLTGEVLFSPSKGDGYSKDEDHLALIMEMFGKIPKDMLLTGKNSKKVADPNDGNLKSVKNLHFWQLEDVLIEKYEFNQKTSQEIANFLKPMFEYDLKKRTSAKELLKHPWLKIDKKI